MFYRIFKLDAIAVSLQLLLVVCMVVTSYAAVPGLISYQGRLTNAAGTPVPDGAYFVRFQIYDAPVGGTSLWNSNIQPVQTKEGVYTYILGQDVAFPNGLFTGGNRWLGITVGVDPELSPRKQMIATSYAFVSQNADSVNWAGIKNVPAGFADGIDDNSGGDITAVSTSGGLSGGAASGAANLSIANGGVTSAHIGDGQIVDADLNASANIAASKIAGTAATRSGSQTFTGRNTFADTVRFANNALAVWTDHVAVGKYTPFYGRQMMNIEVVDTTNDYLKSLQVRAENSGTGEVTGMSSIAYSVDGATTGIAVQSISDNLYRYGAYITTNSASSPSSSGYSVGTKSTATNGSLSIGVDGDAWSANRTVGVRGSSYYASQEGVGVAGTSYYGSPNNIGTYGGATLGSWGVGVYGEAWANSTANWAGYFGGDVNVTGLLFSPAKANRIDHPLDPENRYLQSSDVQSPEMINVYSGNATTDNNGDAEVVLPEYFMAVNSDFRYQLTVVGQFAQAIVASEIRDNRFAIKTDKPTVKVSWQVTGIRQDQFAQAHRVEPEAAKQPFEIGKYLHPELYGLGEERGMKAEIRAEAMKLEAAGREHTQKRDAAARK